jgi:hypothetical protein
MGAVLLMQDRITLSDSTGRTTPLVNTQDEDQWSDGGAWADVIFTVQTFGINLFSSDTADIAIMTSPTKDPTLAQEMLKLEDIAADTVYARNVLLASATNPMQRYIFWKVTVADDATGGPFTLSFRVLAMLKRRA